MLYRPPIKFCNQCGAPVQYRLPGDGDTRERAICSSCGTIQYENPLTVVGTVPVLGEQVLLCQRNIEPRKYKWTLPAGFLELGETVAEGAARETVEEAGAQFTLGSVFTLMSVPQVGQVHIYYLAKLHHNRFDPGHETIEARLFNEADIPWEELAFRTVRHTLECFFADRRAGHFGVHTADMR